MRHINCAGWIFSDDPFPAYRFNLVFGRNKQARAFLPVRGVLPGEDGILPENGFRVIKTREKGTIMIVGGQDTSNRVLAMISCNGGFRGGVSLVDAPDGVILARASAANACNSTCTVAALLAPGQSIRFHSYGRRTNGMYVYAWDGVDLSGLYYTTAEWEASQGAGNNDDAEEL